MASNAPPAPAEAGPGDPAELAEAALHAGDRLLRALDAGDADAVLACAEERGGLVARLIELTGRESRDPALAARFVQQGRELAERVGRAQYDVAHTLCQSGRYHHAADQYAAGGPRHARLQVRG